MRMRNLVAGALTLTAFSIVTGCGDSATTSEELQTTKPHLLALSTYSASLGTPIDAFMANPPPSTARAIELVFEGVFRRGDGREEPVSMTQRANRTEAGAVRWTTFGPFGNPFTPNDPDIGLFKGKVGVKVTNEDGTSTMDESPLPIEFEVKPSVIVTELQPTTAHCDKPALRLIGRLSYKMKAKAVGFKATSIEYSFKIPGIVLDTEGQPVLDEAEDGTTQYRTTTLSHTMAAEGVDAVDGEEVLTLPPVPENVPNYGVIFSIAARDDAGRTVRSTFGMTAHNPLEVYDDKRFTLAEIYPAVPVSSCIPGGQQGRAVDYQESTTEMRQRELRMSFSRSWLKSDENNWSTTDGKTFSTSKTVSDAFSRTHGTQNTLSFERNGSTTNGTSFNWYDSNSTNWSVNVGLKGLVGGDYGRGWTRSDGGERTSSTTEGWSRGESNTTIDSTTVDHSTATTDASDVSKSDTKGGSERQDVGTGESNDKAWTVSSSDMTQRGFQASVIAGTYGVFYRQLARYTRRAFILEFTKCGESEVVGDITLKDYVWAPDLALGQACPPLPQSNFPKPQCYDSQCEL